MMIDRNNVYPRSAYVRTIKAAEMLGITQNRIYEYIRDGRLPAQKDGTQYFILIEDVENFKAQPIGRRRTKSLEWRVYKDAKVLTTEINVQVRAGQQEKMVEKLYALRKSKQHQFPGTIARYAVEGNKQRDSLRIILVWKDTEKSGEAIRQRHLEAFQTAFEDVLDWNTAHIETNETIIYT